MARFLKFIPSEEAKWLLKKKGHAFRLLTIIAEAARRYEGDPDGLKIGECYIGGYENYDMSQQNYRTAKALLVKRQHIEIIETCRSRKKSTTGVTTVGTKVKLLSSTVWDINLEEGNDRSNDCLTTDQRPTNDKQEGIRKIRMKKKGHPSIPSKPLESQKRDEVMIDDFSSEKGKEGERIEVIPGVLLSDEELRACLKVKGDIEQVRRAMEFIQNSKKRKHPIVDWPNALKKWKIETKTNAESNAIYLEALCKEFATSKNTHSWQCRKYTDRNKDQTGLLFECQGAQGGQQPFFVPLSDAKFESKCEEFIKNKKLRKK